MFRETLQRGPVTGRTRGGFGTRGQSRTIGLLVLTVVTIALAVSLAAFSFALTPSEDDNISMASIDITATEESLTVVHDGGDSFQAEDLRVEMNGGEASVQLNAFDGQPDGANLFTAGDRWTHDVTFTDNPVYVAVIHEPSNTVVAETRLTF